MTPFGLGNGTSTSTTPAPAPTVDTLAQSPVSVVAVACVVPAAETLVTLLPRNQRGLQPCWPMSALERGADLGIREYEEPRRRAGRQYHRIIGRLTVEVGARPRIDTQCVGGIRVGDGHERTGRTFFQDHAVGRRCDGCDPVVIRGERGRRGGSGAGRSLSGFGVTKHVVQIELTHCRLLCRFQRR